MTDYVYSNLNNVREKCLVCNSLFDLKEICNKLNEIGVTLIDLEEKEVNVSLFCNKCSSQFIHAFHIKRSGHVLFVDNYSMKGK